MMHATFDAAHDVLYVGSEDAPAMYSREAPTDGYLVLNAGRDGSVVGIILLAASEMPWSFWQTHPDRSVVPAPVLATVDDWIRAKG